MTTTTATTTTNTTTTTTIKNILEISFKIKPQPAALDFENPS